MKKIFSLLAVAALAVGTTAPVHADWNKTYVKVMLDPGHGGEDPGAGRSGYPYEAELVLRCSMAMKGWLEGQHCPLRMTRTTNATVSLSARRSASISYDPWVFCSVHLNAFNGTAHGTETWYYWANRSPSLAQKTQSELVSRLGTTNRGVKQNGWTVITGASYIPAILTEGLFVDNINENNMINNNNNAGFKAWVNAHLQGFKNFMNSENAGIDVDANYGAAVTPPTPQKNPTISCASDLYFECYVGQHPELDLQITGKDLDNNITVTSNAGRFNLVGSSDPLGGKTSVSLGKTGGTVKVRLHDSGAACEYNTNDDNKQTWMNISITSGSVKKTVLLACKVKPNPLQPTEKWNISEAKGNKTSKGYDASQLRNFCYKDGKIYAIYQNADIIVLNAQTGDKLGFLKRGDVVTGGTLRLCDVKTVSGKIVACNLATAGNNENLRIYAWDSDNANPYLVKEIAPSEFNGAYRLGDCLEVTGDWNSDVWFSFGSGKDADNTNKTRIIEWNKKGNNWTKQSYEVVNQWGNSLSTQATVRVYHQSGGWWIDGKDSYPTWATLKDGKAVRGTFVDTGESWGSSHHEFYFGGQKHSANIVFNGKIYKAGSETDVDPNKNYLGGRMRIVQDLTGDFTRVQNVGDYPSDKVTETYDFNGQTMTRETTVGLGLTSRNTNATGDCFVNTDGKNYLEAWVLSTTHGIAYYAHGSVPKQTPAELELQNPEESGTVDPDPVDPTPVVDELGDLTEVWHYSTKKNNLPSWFDKTNFSRSAVVLGDKVIVANSKAWGSTAIKAIDIDNPANATDVNITGIAGGTIVVGALATLNGKLVACNSAATNHNFTVYMWKNGLDQAPEVILKAEKLDVPVGDNMYISNNRIAVAGTANSALKVVWYQINANGSVDPTAHTITVNAGKAVGNRSATSVYFEQDGSFWLNNKDMHPTHYSADGQTKLQEIGKDDKIVGSGGDVFTFGTHRYYAATHSFGGSTTYGNVSTRVLDITDADNAADKGTYPAEGLGDGNWSTAGSTDVKTDVTEYKPGYKRASILTVAPSQGITLYQFEGRTSTTGVDDITADEAANDTEAVYYNLQGVRMSSDNLAPGLYIRKAGKKATKVLVK
ncbi:MAG: N-acetylmuramoyl-L-alanine amidase [Muribaculaceae bacterium]